MGKSLPIWQGEQAAESFSSKSIVLLLDDNRLAFEP